MQLHELCALRRSILLVCGDRRTVAAPRHGAAAPQRAGEVVPGRVGDVRLHPGRLTVSHGVEKRVPSRVLQLRGRRSGFCTST